jgi:hypothetical protein
VSKRVFGAWVSLLATKNLTHNPGSTPKHSLDCFGVELDKMANFWRLIMKKQLLRKSDQKNDLPIRQPEFVSLFMGGNL